jgi:hypothetical protein
VFVEREVPKGRSIVYYTGAHPWKGLCLPGVADYPRKETKVEGQVGERVWSEAEFVGEGMTFYTFELRDPTDKARYAICDLPQHLYFFALHRDSDGAHPYRVKPTAAHKKMMERIQAAYTLDNITGHLKARKDALQLESDLDALLKE